MVSGPKRLDIASDAVGLAAGGKRIRNGPDTQPTRGFKAIMREAADTRSYAAALSVLLASG
jgi:thiaminase/transcriptional activator TenA